MGEMATFPYLTGRKGTKNLYYKRLVPLELRATGRPGQVWRSLKTSDRKRAEAAYGATHVEVCGSHQIAEPTKSSCESALQDGCCGSAGVQVSDVRGSVAQIARVPPDVSTAEQALQVETKQRLMVFMWPVAAPVSAS